jgi:acyl-CoA thioesterase
MYEKVYEEPMVEGAQLPFELPAWIACAPFEEFLGMRIEEAAEGRAVLAMPFKVKLAQGKGLMHGGAVTALADTAVAMAIKSLLPEGTNFVTTELALKFHAPIHGGTVRAVAEATRKDERTLKGIAEVFDGNGVKAATFTSVFRVKRR